MSENFKNFDEKISKLLNSLSKADSWSDLNLFANRISSSLKKGITEFNFSLLSNKATLSKRLAQCLNPECPARVHESVLRIYSMILENIISKNDGKLGDNLGLYSSGLFPFFSYATLNNKNLYLKIIISNCFLKLNENELAICLSGLISSLIPGFEDNDEKLSKEIYSIFDKIQTKLKKGVFFGTYWSLLLRNKLLRTSGFKYLSDKIIKYADYVKLDEEKKKEKLENEFPDINNLVVNSISMLIGEKDIPTLRNVMDFVISRFPLTEDNKMIDEKSKILLITNALKLLIINHYSATRRLYNWLLGQNNKTDEIYDKPPDINYKMDLVVEAFKNMFSSELINSNNLKNYVQIIERLFDQLIFFNDDILPKVAYDLILCFVQYWITELNSSENAINNEIIINLSKFFYKNNNIKCLWKSIMDYLDSNHEKVDLDFNNNKKDFSVKKVELFIYKIIQPLKFCCLFLCVQSYEGRINYYIPIINNLLKIMIKIKFEKETIIKVQHILSITLIFTKIFQEKQFQNETNLIKIEKISTLKRRMSLFTQLNQDDNENGKEQAKEFYNISEEMKLKNIKSNKYYIDILNSFTATIVNYRGFYINLLKQFFLFDSNTQITKNELDVFRNSTELMIRLQEYAQISEIPEWIRNLEKMVFDEKINTKLSLEAANSLLDLNLSSFENQEIYQKIKSEFSKNEIEQTIIGPKYLNILQTKTGVSNIYQELLIGKYFLMLNDQSNRRMVIDQLVKLLKLDEKRFLNVIENTLKLEDTSSNNAKLLSDLWNLIGEYNNKGISFKSEECLFKMLDYLDSQNPLLKHFSKIWLDNSYKKFQKIVNPILSVRLKNEIEINNFETKNILHSYQNLRSLIMNSSLMELFIKIKPNDEILNLWNNPNEKEQNNYLSVLINISLHFMSYKKGENFEEKIQKEISSINESSCEFLEFLLSNIDDPKIMMKYFLKLNFQILSLMNYAFESKKKIIQVKLLSILRILYSATNKIGSKLKKYNYVSLNIQLLIVCLQKGITSDDLYLREKFLNFTRNYFPIFKKILDDISYYYLGSTILSSLTSYIATNIKIDTIGRKDTARFSHFYINNNINFFIFKNYLAEYKEYKIYDEGNLLIMLKGLGDVVCRFFNVNRNDDKTPEEFWPHFKSDLTGNIEASSGILFGLFGDGADGNEKEKRKIDKNINEIFVSLIEDILQSLLMIWINESEKYEPYDFCLNSNGILPLREVNKEIFTQEDIKEGLKSIREKPLKKIIRDVGYNLFLANPIEFMKAIVNLWCINPNKSQEKLHKDAQNKVTIIEFLIALNIPLNIILYCLKCCLQRKIKFEKEKETNMGNLKYKKDPRLNEYITPYESGVLEAKVIHFIYSYILLNPFYENPAIIYNNDPTRNEICESWREMVKTLNTLISDTKIIYTHCWIYELLGLTLTKLDLNKVSDSKVKNKITEIFNTITDKLIDCVFNNKTDSININKGNLILPYLPHIYLNIVKTVFSDEVQYLYNKYFISSQNIDKEIFSELKKNNFSQTKANKSNSFLPAEIDSKVNEFYILFYSVTKLCTEKVPSSQKCYLDGVYLNAYYRRLSCITLKENYYKCLSSLYGYSNLFKKNLTNIIKQLIDFLKSNLKEQKKGKNKDKNKDKNDEDEYKKFYAEFASDFLSCLMKDCPSFVTSCGKSMFMDYLKDPSFFKTTPQILRNWRKLFSLLPKHYPEIISELFENIKSGFSFLGGNDEEKIEILRRISFIIFSCEKDDFKKDLVMIKKNAKFFLSEFKGDKNRIKLETVIFLLLKILFLRFSHESVLNIIKDLWPIIFNELIENFKNESRNKNIPVLIESFRFIELLSLANEEEFTLYQWIFLLDTFNMKDLDTRNNESLLSQLIKRENKIFRPIAVDIISDGNMAVDDNMIKGNQVGKSQLVIKTEGETKEELQKAVKKFFYSIGDMNNYNVEINYEQIEDIIEKDFLMV